MCWNLEMATPAEELDVDGVKVRLTNPDKVYFPKLGSEGTKRRLVEYYVAVASGPMLTALRDRPTHLQRFPDGIGGEEIYQKRIPQHAPDYLETCTVTFPSGRTADALKVTHPSAIVWAAQMGTITLHPWQVRCADTEHPDELRVDLDPQPGTGFKEASGIAVDVLKPVLDELGLIGYPKTSGGRGVHVFLRIKTDWDFIAVRRAGIALAREVERRAPDAVTTSWWKEERGKRIFLDYNQNARDRTFASAYSARKTPIATVSMPLTWDELRDADPDDYTITTAPDLVAHRDDPWAEIDSKSQSLQPLLEMVKADEERGLGDLPYPSVFSRNLVCAGVSCAAKSRSGLRFNRALRCRPSEGVDSVDNDAAGDLAGRILGRAGRLQRGRRMRSSAGCCEGHADPAVE
jgi:DNA ligase D